MNSIIASRPYLAQKGPFKCYVMKCRVGGGGCHIFLKKHYEDVGFNVISVTRGWVGVKFPNNKAYKRYVTLEWPPYIVISTCPSSQAKVMVNDRRRNEIK